MSQWTAEQEAAILARGASIVVSAAAGSGKTSVLVERLISLLADSSEAYPAERIVVVTFTKDAAGEVRKRLNMELARRMREKPDNAWMRRQQTMLQSAKITTIHGFCFDLIREQFSILNVPSSFRIMEQKEEDTLREEIAAEVLEAFYQAAAEDAETAAKLKCLTDAFCGQDDTLLDALILQLYKLETDTPFGSQLTEDAARLCEEGSMKLHVLDKLKSSLAEISALYAKAKELALLIECASALKTLQTEITRLDSIVSAVEAGNFADIAAALDGFKKEKLSAIKKGGTEEQRLGIKALRNHAAEWIDQLKQTWSVPLKYAEKDLSRHGTILHVLTELLTAFSESLMERKQERSALGFSDAMVMTLSLLAKREADGSITKTELAEHLSRQYVCIMIDEFQDADNQQDLIFRMLSNGGNAEHYGNNLFVVGDSKQCIYRFRNANPQNFYQAMLQCVPYQTPDLKENTCINLNRNFRSGAEVVETVNIVFSALMTEGVGEIRYDDTQILVQGASYPEAVRKTEAIIYQQPTAGAAELEAALTARRIRFHLDNQTMVKGKDGSLRPCEPRDFMLLMRNSTSMPKFVAALKAENIPVCSLQEEGYLKSPELLLLLDILRGIDNPLLEVPLSAAMLSPLFAFTLDELVQLRVDSPKEKLFNAMLKLQKAAEEQEEGGDLRLAEKCGRFLRFLESMRLRSVMDTPEQLIRFIFEETDLLGIMQMGNDGARKKANLRALLMHAASFEQTRGGGLSAFLRYIDTVLLHGSDLDGGGVPTGTENVVMLKTIHSSKGLEAPFVILADTGNSFGHREDESGKLVRHHSELGIGFRLHDPETFTRGRTLPWVMIDERCREEQISEEMRLLYVALTRAREYLILLMPYSKKKKEELVLYAAEQAINGGQTDALTRMGKSYADWLFMAMIRNTACALMRQILEIPIESDSRQGMLPVAVLTEEMEESGEKVSEAEESAVLPDEVLTQQLAQQCAFRYLSKEAELTAKYGVSELAKEENFDAPLRRPLFKRNRNGLTGAERGTAIHTFMQYADFAAAAENTEKEVARLQTEGRLTKRQAEAISASPVDAFFASDLYERIRCAKRIWREQKFTVRLSDLHLTNKLAELGERYNGTEGMLIGIMDLVFEEEDGIVLVDYKTDYVEKAEDLLEKYTEQIRLYAEALRLLMDKPVKECCLYSVPKKKIVQVIL
ncbi:MAG: helicase-exonuclease AddAB subunit AddA [Oscillospiraceae bacterium]|nr:helicase-exonuclease AddAB subunit AddA [Oscillospiraceae bacterium]